MCNFLANDLEMRVTHGALHQLELLHMQKRCRKVIKTGTALFITFKK